MKDVTGSAPEIQDDSKYLGSNLPVTKGDFDALAAQRKLLQEFVSKQLRKDVDYGVIPGTPKPSLYKPGAEKLKMLFGLGVRFVPLQRELDRNGNFCMFTYKAEVFHLKTDRLIAECEGMCNSQEVKYKERSVYEYNKQSRKREFVRKEPTPVCDIANTISKMAQKRAFVGAVILATGASDFFSQDIDDPQDAQTINVTATEAPKENPIPGVKSAKTSDDAGGEDGLYVARMGKFKDQPLRDIDPQELAGYVDALKKYDQSAKPMAMEFIQKAEKFLGSTA